MRHSPLRDPCAGGFPPRMSVPDSLLNKQTRICFIQPHHTVSWFSPRPSSRALRKSPDPITRLPNRRMRPKASHPHPSRPHRIRANLHAAGSPRRRMQGDPVDRYGCAHTLNAAQKRTAAATTEKKYSSATATAVLLVRTYPQGVRLNTDALSDGSPPRSVTFVTPRVLRSASTPAGTQFGVDA